MPADTWAWIKLYGHYTRNMLPYSGGILDQPAPFMEAMEVIDQQLKDDG